MVSIKIISSDIWKTGYNYKIQIINNTINNYYSNWYIICYTDSGTTINWCDSCKINITSLNQIILSPQNYTPLLSQGVELILNFGGFGNPPSSFIFFMNDGVLPLLFVNSTPL